MHCTAYTHLLIMHMYIRTYIRTYMRTCVGTLPEGMGGLVMYRVGVTTCSEYLIVVRTKKMFSKEFFNYVR